MVMGKDRKILLIGAAVTVVALLAGGLWLGGAPHDTFADCRNAIAAKTTKPLGGPFTLTDQNGRRVSDNEILAEPALLYFGYTYCPDICPVDAARNAEAVAILDAKGYRITPVFISVDPERDRPAVLRDFVQAMHPRMIGLTGTQAEIDAVSQKWRSYFKRNAKDASGNYLIDHTTNTYLIMPGAGTVEFFGREIAADELAHRTSCFLDAAKARGI